MIELALVPESTTSLFIKLAYGAVIRRVGLRGLDSMRELASGAADTVTSHIVDTLRLIP